MPLEKKTLNLSLSNVYFLLCKLRNNSLLHFAYPVNFYFFSSNQMWNVLYMLHGIKYFVCLVGAEFPP